MVAGGWVSVVALREVLDPAVVPSAADTTSGGGWRCQEESEKGTWVDVMGNLGADHGVFECERSCSETEEVFYEGQKYSTAGEILVPKRVLGKAVRPANDHNLEQVPFCIAQTAFSLCPTSIFPGLARKGKDASLPMCHGGAAICGMLH